MGKNRPVIIASSLSVIVFYICWGIPQFIDKYRLVDPILSSLFFSTVYTGLAGTLLPVLIRQTWRMPYSKETSRISSVAGYSILAAVIAAGIVFSGALEQVMTRGITVSLTVKYVLLFFPMSLGLSLFAFLIIPRIVDTLVQGTASRFMVAVVTASIFFFIGFFIDTTFDSLELAVTMGLLGLMFSMANRLIGSFRVAFTAFFVTMVFNTLGEGKYDGSSWFIAAVSTLISVCIIGYDFFKLKKEP